MSRALMGSLEPDWPPAHYPLPPGPPGAAFLARAAFGNGRKDVHRLEKRWPRTSTVPDTDRPLEASARFIEVN
jgi:hypothetical protein